MKLFISRKRKPRLLAVDGALSIARRRREQGETKNQGPRAWFFIKYVKNLIVFLVMFLIILNGYFFAKTMILGNSLIKIEKEMKKLKIENSEIEKKVYSLNSLQNLQEVASFLGFVKNTELFYLESLKFTPSKTEHKLARTAKIDRYE